MTVRDAPYRLVELGKKYRYADPPVMWYAAGSYEAGNTVAFIPCTATSDKAEALVSVAWANERHCKVRDLSLAQGFQGVYL